MLLDLKTIATDAILFALEETAPYNSNSGLLSLPNRLSALNKAYQRMGLDMQSKDHPYLNRYLNTEVDPTTRTLRRRISPEMGRIVCISPRYTDIPSDDERNAVARYRRAQSHGQSFSSRFVLSGGYEIQGGEIRILSFMPTGQRYRIWYAANVPLLHYGLTVGDGTASTLALNTAPEAGRYDIVPNSYIDSPVMLYAGPGPDEETPFRPRIARIVSVDDETSIATCTSIQSLGEVAFPQPPVKGDTTATTTAYCILPIFGSQWYEYWINLAAGNYFGKLDGAAAARANANESMDRWLGWCAHIDSSSIEPLNDNWDTDMGVGPGSFGGLGLTRG